MILVPDKYAGKLDYKNYDPMTFWLKIPSYKGRWAARAFVAALGYGL